MRVEGPPFLDAFGAILGLGDGESGGLEDAVGEEAIRDLVLDEEDPGSRGFRRAHGSTLPEEVPADAAGQKLAGHQRELGRRGGNGHGRTMNIV